MPLAFLPVKTLAQRHASDNMKQLQPRSAELPRIMTWCKPQKLQSCNRKRWAPGRQPGGLQKKWRPSEQRPGEGNKSRVESCCTNCVHRCQQHPRTHGPHLVICIPPRFSEAPEGWCKKALGTSMVFLGRILLERFSPNIDREQDREQDKSMIKVKWTSPSLNVPNDALQSAPQDSATPPSMDVAKSKGKVETIKHDRKTLRSKAAPPSQETPHASDWNGLLAQTALKDLLPPVPPVPPCCWSISQHPRLTCLTCFMNLHTICTLCMHMMFALCFKMHLTKFVLSLKLFSLSKSKPFGLLW